MVTVLAILRGTAAPATSLRCGLVAAAFCLALLGARADAQLPEPIRVALQAAGLPESAIGVVVERVADQHRVIAHQAERSFQPASTMKLLTTAVALERLGATHRGRSELRSSAVVAKGVLQGDLVLRGAADTDLNTVAFRGMLLTLRLQGIDEISGDFLLDRSFFSPSRMDIGVPPFDESPEFQYNVIPDAISLNHHLLELTIDATAADIQVRANTTLDGVTLTSVLTTIDGQCKDWDDGWQAPAVAQLSEGAVRITLQGQYPKNCVTTTEINVLDRTDFEARLFRSLWRELGGRFSGNVREGSLREAGKVLAEHRARALPESVRTINKTSDNPLTRSVYLTLGALSRSADLQATTAANSEQVVRAWLRDNGVSDAELVLENGSGLSRTERVTPRLLADVLRTMTRSSLAPEFLASLPIVGVDGSMRNRLKESPATGHARIKTGSLRNVAAIAGYVFNADNELHTVVALINDANAKHAVARPVLDALIDWISRQPGPAPIAWWQRWFRMNQSR